MLAVGALSVAGADALVDSMRKWLAALRPQETAGVLFTFDTICRKSKRVRRRPRRARSTTCVSLRVGQM